MEEVAMEEDEKKKEEEEAPSVEVYPTDMNTLLDWYQRERRRNEEWTEYLSELLPALRSLLYKWEERCVPSASSTSSPVPSSSTLSFPQTDKASSLSLVQLIKRGEAMRQPLLLENSSLSPLPVRELCPSFTSGGVDACPPLVPPTTMSLTSRLSTAEGHEQEEDGGTRMLHDARRISACTTSVPSSSPAPVASCCSSGSPNTPQHYRSTAKGSSRPTSSGRTEAEKDLALERVQVARVGMIVQGSQEEHGIRPSPPILRAKGVIITGSVKEKPTPGGIAFPSPSEGTTRGDGGVVVGSPIPLTGSIRMPTTTEGCRTTTSTVAGSAHSGRVWQTHHDNAGTAEEVQSSIHSSPTVGKAPSASPPLPCSSSSFLTTGSPVGVASGVVRCIPERAVETKKLSTFLPFMEGKTTTTTSDASGATPSTTDLLPSSLAMDYTENAEEKHNRRETRHRATTSTRMEPTTTENPTTTTTNTIAPTSPARTGHSLAVEEEAEVIRDWIQGIEKKYIQEVEVDALRWREEVERLRTLMAEMEEEQRLTRAAYKQWLQITHALVACVPVCVQGNGTSGEKRKRHSKKIADNGVSDAATLTRKDTVHPTTPFPSAIGEASSEARCGSDAGTSHDAASRRRSQSGNGPPHPSETTPQACREQRASPTCSDVNDPHSPSPTTSRASSANRAPSPVSWVHAVDVKGEDKAWQQLPEGDENEHCAEDDSAWEQTEKAMPTETSATVHSRKEGGAPHPSSLSSSSWSGGATPMEWEALLSELLAFLQKERCALDKFGTRNALSQRLLSVEYAYCHYRACTAKEAKELLLLRQKTCQLEGQIERLSSIQVLHTPVKSTIASMPTGTALGRTKGVAGSSTGTGTVIQRGTTISTTSLPTSSAWREMEESKKENEKRIEKMDAQMKEMQQKLDRRNVQVIENAKVISRLENTITTIQADNRSSRQAFQLLKRQFDELELDKELGFLEKTDTRKREKAGDNTNDASLLQHAPPNGASSSTSHSGSRDTRDRELLNLQRGFMERKIRYDIESAQWEQRETLYLSSHHELSLRVVELLHEVLFLEAVVNKRRKDASRLQKEETCGEEKTKKSTPKSTLVEHSVPSSSLLHSIASPHHGGGTNRPQKIKKGRRHGNANDSATSFTPSTEEEEEEEQEQAKRADEGPIRANASLQDVKDAVDHFTSSSSQCFSLDGKKENYKIDREDTQKTEKNVKESDRHRRREKRIQEQKEDEEAENEVEEERWRQRESTWEMERKALQDRLTQTEENHEAEKRKWRIMVHELQRTVTLLKASKSPSVQEGVTSSSEGGTVRSGKGCGPLDKLPLFTALFSSTPHRRSSSTCSPPKNDPAEERRFSILSQSPASSAQRERNSMESFSSVPAEHRRSSSSILGGKTQEDANGKTKSGPLINPEGIDLPSSLSHSPPPRAENTLAEGEAVNGSKYQEQERLWDEERRVLRQAVRDAQEKYEKVLKELDERPLAAKEGESPPKGAGVAKHEWSKRQKLFSTSSLTSSSPSFGHSGVSMRRSADVKTIQLVLEETLMEKLALEERITTLEREKKQKN